MENGIKNQLDSLLGQTVSFEKKNYQIDRYKEVSGNIIIFTNSRTFQFYPSEIQEDFIDLLGDPIDDDPTLPHIIKNRSIVFPEQTGLVKIPEENINIKNTLMEALQKVKEDPGFLKQAKAICDITNAMVNVQKTEIEMIKLQKDHE